jgi:hypothetical protein
MSADELLVGLPGEDLIREGVADLKAGRVSVAACLAAMAFPRLQRLGLLRAVPPGLSVDVELQLYRLLRLAGGDAYSRYNALLGRLVSFEQALDRRIVSQQSKTDAISFGSLPGVDSIASGAAESS